MLTVGDWNVAKSILTWSNGTLIDRRESHAAAVWLLLAPCLLLAPRVGWELDLLQSGEDDARALGVDTARVRKLTLFASTLATAAAVSVAGQIAFVGLIVPHLVRLCGVRSYRALPALSALAGALLLVAADTAQLVLLDDRIAPGVLMSVVGGPFFVWLLWRRRDALALW
jgi:iron complex transport system permease protein